jgi:hypothetical protein
MSDKTKNKGVSPKSLATDHPHLSTAISKRLLEESGIFDLSFATNDATVVTHQFSQKVLDFFGTYVDKNDNIAKSRIGNTIDRAIAVSLDKMVQAGKLKVEDLSKIYIHFGTTFFAAENMPISRAAGKTKVSLNGIAFMFYEGVAYLLSSFNMEKSRAPESKFFSMANSNALQLRDSICFDMENTMTVTDLYQMAYGWTYSFTLRNISGSNRFCSTIEGAELAKKVIEQCAVDDESMEVALARVTEYLNLCNTHAWTPRRMSDLELLGHVGASEAEADAKASAGQSEDDTPDELKALFAGAMVD